MVQRGLTYVKMRPEVVSDSVLDDLYVLEVVLRHEALELDRALLDATDYRVTRQHRRHG